MTTGSSFVWAIAGDGIEFSPPATPGQSPYCYLCGGTTDDIGWPREGTIPETFTHVSRVAQPDSDTVCQACVALQSKSTWECYVAAHPEAGLKTGHAVSWRNYSHAAWAGHHECPSRDRWRDLLVSPPDPPFVYVIAVSSQKHLLFTSQVAHSRDTYPLIMEEDRLIVRRDVLARVLDAFEALLALGHSRDQVLSGQYDSHRVLKIGLRAHRQAEDAIQPYRSVEPDLMRVAHRVARNPKKE